MNFLKTFSKNKLLKIAIFMSIISFFGINIISNNILKSFRFDMTSNNLFSLTKGTKNLISNLKEPIHLRLFMSSSIVKLAPQLSNYANRVESILNAYENISNGKITLESDKNGSKVILELPSH